MRFYNVILFVFDLRCKGIALFWIMQIFKELFLLNKVNKFTFINNLFLNMLETILYDFTHTSFLITIQRYKNNSDYANNLS